MNRFISNPESSRLPSIEREGLWTMPYPTCIGWMRSAYRVAACAVVASVISSSVGPAASTSSVSNMSAMAFSFDQSSSSAVLQLQRRIRPGMPTNTAVSAPSSPLVRRHVPFRPLSAGALYSSPSSSTSSSSLRNIASATRASRRQRYKMPLSARRHGQMASSASDAKIRKRTKNQQKRRQRQRQVEGGKEVGSTASFRSDELQKQADELEKLLERTSTTSSSSFELSDEQQHHNAYDPFDIDRTGGNIYSTQRIEFAPAESIHPPLLFGFMNDTWKARLLVVVAAALYGTNFSVVKILDGAMPVGISTTIRFAMAAAATLPWLLAPASPGSADEKAAPTADAASAGRNLLSEERDGAKGRSRFGLGRWWNDALESNVALAAAVCGFEVGMWNSIGYIAQAVGLETTEAGKSAFICSLAVIIVPILDFFAGKKFLPRELVGASMAVAGVGLLEFGGGDGFHQLSSGDIASLIQPLAFGMGFWRMEDAMHRFPSEATRATAGQMLAVFCSSMMFCLYSYFAGGVENHIPMGQIMTWLTDPSMLGALLWTGIITTAMTVYMETLALKTLSAAETTMIFSTEPLWGAAFAAAVLGERFGLEAGVGAALILIGIAYSNIGLNWLSNATKKVEVETGEK